MRVAFFLALMVHSGLARCSRDRVCLDFQESDLALSYAEDLCRMHADVLVKLENPESLDFTQAQK
ncbi:unnamed protein product, partial [Candidula unifasciata]